jgi:hypothetical protein
LRKAAMEVGLTQNEPLNTSISAFLLSRKAPAMSSASRAGA